MLRAELVRSRDLTGPHACVYLFCGTKRKEFGEARRPIQPLARRFRVFQLLCRNIFVTPKEHASVHAQHQKFAPA